MSIIKCNICEYQIDSDLIDCTEYNGKEVCQECYNEATHALVNSNILSIQLRTKPESTWLEWDLTKETLEEQTEETQEAVAKLLGFGEGEND